LHLVRAADDEPASDSQRCPLRRHPDAARRASRARSPRVLDRHRHDGADVSGKAIANLEIERITHEAPTFIGDTIYSESTVLATRESRRGDRGTVTVETRVTNQRGERVMTFKRTALVPKKNHATLGQQAQGAIEQAPHATQREQAQPRPPRTGHPRPKRDS
jgi:hypothetical protein